MDMDKDNGKCREMSRKNSRVTWEQDNFSRIYELLVSHKGRGYQVVKTISVSRPLMVSSYLGDSFRNQSSFITLLKMSDGCFILHGVHYWLRCRQEQVPTVRAYIISNLLLTDIINHYTLTLFAATVCFEGTYPMELFYYVTKRENYRLETLKNAISTVLSRENVDLSFKKSSTIRLRNVCKRGIVRSSKSNRSAQKCYDSQKSNLISKKSSSVRKKAIAVALDLCEQDTAREK